MVSGWEFRDLKERVESTERRVENIMATVAEIKQALVDASASLANVVADIQALKDKITAGGVATAQDLNDILLAAQSLGTGLKAADDSVVPDTVP